MVATRARHDDLARAAIHRLARQTPSAEAGDESAFASSLTSIRTIEPPSIGPAPTTGRGSDRRAVATVLRLQQTYGNQAVQRLLQRDDEPIPTPTVGDYKVLPPKPTTETDTTYDTHDDHSRATQQTADERGESPKPDEWWKDKPRKPKPTDPKDYSDLDKWRGKEKPSDGGTDFGPLPPAEEQQPGDYPLTPAIEPEDAAYA